MSLPIASTANPDAACVAAAQRARAVAAAAPVSPTTPGVIAALAAFERVAPGHVVHWADGSGGAHVFLDSVDLGPPFAQATTWVAFHLPHTLPDGDIYPVWMRSDLARLDGGAIGETNAAGQNFMHQNQAWLAEPAVMISLRTNDRDPAVDSPTRKVARVLTAVRST